MSLLQPTQEHQDGETEHQAYVRGVLLEEQETDAMKLAPHAPATS